MIKTRLPLGLALGLSSVMAFGLPEIDGTKDAGYIPLSVQNTETGFGDSNLGTIDYANGSELDNLYYVRTATTLFIFVGGNVESNFNKLEIFLDTGTGGDNRLLGSYPDVDFGALNRMSDDGSGNGMKFDTVFNPTHWYSMTCGGSPFAIYANFSEVKSTVAGGVGYYLGTTTAGLGSLSNGNNPNGVEATFNNSNVAGVPGGNGVDAGNGAGVMTGAEIAIPLSEIGSPTGPIKISVMINGGGHDYMSNQVLPGIGGGGNLAEPRLVDFSAVPGDQCVVIPPLSITLTPTAYNVLLGSTSAGTLADLSSIDNSKLKLCKALVPTLTSPKIRMDVDFLSPNLNPSSVKLDINANMNNGGSFAIRGFVADRTGGGYAYGAANQVIADTPILLNGNVGQNFTGTTTLPSRIHTDGTARARIEIQQTGLSPVAVPCTSFDLVTLTVQ